MPLLELDPDSVQAGVLPLIIVLGMAVVLALGFWNMRSHIRKIKAPYAVDLADGESSQSPAEHDDVQPTSTG